MKKILITNDDGITSDGIIRLAQAALQFGEVWVVAPAQQRSAASHSITLHSPVDLSPHDFPVPEVRAYACSGTPGDCVRTGMLFLMDRRPDVVLSGINYGYNAASDIQYSATCGAAFEAAYQGCIGIALSEKACSCHEVTDHFLVPVLEQWMDVSPGPGRIWNINFPGCLLADCRGVLENRRVSAGAFYRDRYRQVAPLPGGGARVIVEGIYNEDAEEDTDFRALVDSFVSIGAVRNVG